MSEFLEILSEGALEELKQAEKLVKSLADDIKTINSFKVSNTPSGADKNIQGANTALKEQASALDEVRKRLLTIASLNKQRYQEEAKLIADNDKALSYKSEKELKQIRDKQAMIASLNKQKNDEIAETQKQVLANEKLNRAYVQLTANREKAKQKLQDYIAEETRSTAEIRKAQKEFDVLNKKVAAADKAVGRFSDANRKINGLASSVGNLMTAFGVGTGIYLAMDIGKSIYNTTKELQSMNLALEMVSGTQEKYAENTSFISKISEKWGLELKSTTQQFTKFYADAKGKLSDSEIKETYEGIAKSGSVMGLSLQKQESAFTAFQQMLSKGTIQAQELKLQLGDALPGSIKVATAAYQKLHPELKVTEALLYKHMEQGKVISAEMIPEMVKGYQKLYGIENVNNINTLASSQNRVQNSWTKLVKSMNESETGGITKFFTFFINRATDMLNVLTRANTSWDELYKKAGLEGRGKGFNIGEDRFNQGGGTVSGANAAIKVAEKELSRLQKEYIENQKRGNELTDKIKNRAVVVDIADLAFQIDGDQERLLRLKENKERILEEIAIQGGILAKVKGLKKDIGKDKTTKTPVLQTPAKIKSGLKAERDANKEREQIAKESYEAELSNLERQKELILDLKDAEETSLEDKLFLEKAYAYKQIQIAQFVYDEKVRIADKEIKERKLTSVEGENLKTPLNNELQTSIENAKSESLARINKLTEENLKKEDEKTKEWYKNNPPFFVENEDSKKAREETVRLNQKALEDVKNYIASFQIELGQNLGFDETANFFLKMDTDGRTMFDKLNSMADGSKEKQIATFQAIAESAQETFNFIANASQKNFDEEYARLEKEKDARLAFAGDSDTAKKKIEEDYEKRRKEIAIREFKAKQKMAIVNIAIDTAQAVMAVSAKAQWWQVPLMIALGAVQAGIVASQKVPEYWKGTGNALEGLAYTQERGAEIITDKKGVVKDFGDNKGARLTMMEQGDKVYTADQTKRMMFNRDLNSIMTDNGIANAPQIIVNSQGMTEQQMESVMMRTLGSMAVESTVIDANGFKQVISKGHSRTIEHTARITGRGLKIGR